MKRNESIEHVLENMDKSVIYKTRSSRLLSILLLVGGAISFVIYSTFEWTSTDTFQHLLFIAGTISCIFGTFMFFLRKKFYVSAINHQKLNDMHLYFKVSEHESLVRMIENGNLKAIKSLKASVSDGLKLRIMATKDGQICFSQVIAYVNNEYSNITEVKSHSVEDALFIAEYSRQNRK